jgi:hypothetical protein
VSLAAILSERMHDLPAARDELVKKAGGFDWSCEEESICERRSASFCGEHRRASGFFRRH